MIENIPALLKAFDTAAGALKAFAGWRSKTEGDARSIIEELKENSRYFWLVIEKEASLNEIVDKLSTQEYDRLSKEGFNFNSLKKEEIPNFTSLEKTDLSSWQGKKTNELVLNIYDKVKDLRAKYPLSKNSKKIRWDQRVKNVQKRILLLLRHAGT
jgi:hypothetical protein